MLGLRETYLASREVNLASVETGGNWSDPCSRACCWLGLNWSCLLICSQWSLGDPLVLPCMECWATPREKFLELFLVKVDDQIFDGNGFNILTVAL